MGKKFQCDFSKTMTDMGSYEVTQPSDNAGGLNWSPKPTMAVAESPNPESPQLKRPQGEAEADLSKAGLKKANQLQPSHPSQKGTPFSKKQYDDNPAAFIRPNRTDMSLPCFQVAL